MHTYVKVLYLKDGSLEINLGSRKRSYIVEPLKIDLSRVGTTYKNRALTADKAKRFSLELYFDPLGKGGVTIRHMGQWHGE